MAQDKALRKRQQISRANRTMFLTVAATSAVVGVALVAIIFLGQRLIFNEKILIEKQKTVSVLKKNNTTVGELKSNIRVLNTNQNLLDSRANPDDTPLRVILDALPADANSSALGASLQQVLLADDSISIDSLSVTPVAGLESSDESSDAAATTSENAIGFSFAVSTPADGAENLRQLMQRLERSIRIVKIVSYEIERQGSRLSLKATAEAYYQPETSATLKDKVVKP